jgi:D-proline reductase (dithiol) PrdB
MPDRVDSFRFLDFITRKIIQAWIQREPAREIPWTPLGKPLSESRVASISSAGIALRDDRPFDQEGERQNPWWGDPSFRVLPKKATQEDVEIYHLHINPEFGRRDLNCILPLQRLAELAESGEIGDSAPRHYSFMGYTIDPTELLESTTPEMVRLLKEDQVDLVLLAPT